MMFEEDDPLQALLKTKQAPAEEIDPLDELIASKKLTPALPAVDEVKPGIGSKLLGVIASVNRKIPGAEAAQAGIRSLVRGQSYREALDDIHGAEDAAPAWATKPVELAGGVLSAMAIPGGAALSGARYGALNALASSNPDANVADRLHNAAWEAPLGALAGKAGEKLSPLVRSRIPVKMGGPRSPGTVALEHKAEVSAADRMAYGRAANEGAGAMTTPEVTAALNAPDIQPFVKAIRGSRSFQGADDATVLREAYRQMTERQGQLIGKLSGKDFKAGTSLEQADIGLAKQELKAAGATMMPSFPGAVAQHAAKMGERDSFRAAADATRRITRGVQPAAKNLEANSPEAFAQMISGMKAGEAKTATEGVLGTLKNQTGFRANPLKLFGLGPAVQKSARVAPYMNALDSKTGSNATEILRSLGITVGVPTNR